MPPKKTKAAAPKEPTTLRVEEWGEFTKGAPIKVTAPFWRGKNSLSWRFVAHVTNLLTGSTWIDVFGGPKGYETNRSFSEDQVELIRPKRKYTKRSKA